MVGIVRRNVIESAGWSRLPAGFDAFVTAITAITTFSRVPRGRGGRTRTARRPSADQRCGRVGAAIGPIAASRSSREREVVGKGSLLEAREDQRALRVQEAPT